MKTILRMILVITVCVSATVAQGIFDKIKDKAKSKVETASGETYSHFARFEVQLSWKENGAWKYKTRVYYSDIIELSNAQMHDRENKTNLIIYFNDGITTPLEAKGFQVRYYTTDVKIFPLSAAYASRKEAEEDMQKKIDVDQSNEREIYTFVWKYGEKVDGEKTTAPKKFR